MRLDFDAGVVYRVHDSGNFRYAIVILGLPPEQRRELTLALDETIIQFHDEIRGPHENCKTC